MRRLLFHIEKEIRKIARNIGGRHWMEEGVWKVPCEEYVIDLASFLSQFVKKEQMYSFSVNIGMQVNVEQCTIDLVFEDKRVVTIHQRISTGNLSEIDQF